MATLDQLNERKNEAYAAYLKAAVEYARAGVLEAAKLAPGATHFVWETETDDGGECLGYWFTDDNMEQIEATDPAYDMLADVEWEVFSELGGYRSPELAGHLTLADLQPAGIERTIDRHGDPAPTLEPHCAVGDRVQTYDGPGVVTAIRDDSFYGAAPRRRGELTGEPYDGCRYDVLLDNGRRDVFDRSRLQRVEG